MSTVVAYSDRGTPFETETIDSPGAPTKPAVNVGDMLMIVAVVNSSNIDGSLAYCSDPGTDWTALPIPDGGVWQFTGNQTGGKTQIWYRFADGTAADTPPNVELKYDGGTPTNLPVMIVECWRIINPDQQTPFGAVPNVVLTAETSGVNVTGTGVFTNDDSMVMVIGMNSLASTANLGDFPNLPAMTQWVDNNYTGTNLGVNVWMETVAVDAAGGATGDYSTVISMAAGSHGVIVLEFVAADFDGPAVNAEYTVEIAWQRDGLIIGSGVIGDSLVGIGYDFRAPLDDDFEDRTNGALPGQGSWISTLWGDPDIQVLDGQLYTNAAAGSWRGADYAVEYSYGKLRIEMAALPEEGRYAEFYALIDPAGSNTMVTYRIRRLSGVMEARLGRYFNGTIQEYGSWVDIGAYGPSPLVEVEVLPDRVLKAYINEVLVQTATHDLDNTSGYVGLEVNAPAVRIESMQYLELSDVSADTEEFTIRRGRDDPLTTIQAGTCDLTLFDDDGRYNPENTTSPLYGAMKPMREVRIRATFQGQTYGLFRGVIRDVEFDPVSKRTSVQCEDIFLRLSRLKPVIAETTAGTTGSLISDILEAVQVPASLNGVGDADGDSGFTFSMAGTADARTALQGISDLLEAERGVFYINKDGVATYRDRYSQLTAASALTLTNVFSNFAPGLSIDNVINTARVTKTDGVQQIVTDLDSEGLYGPADITIDSPYFPDDTAALALANFLVFQLAEPRNPVWELPFIANYNALVMNAVLAAELLDRITITNADQPGLAGDYYIEAMTHAVVKGAMHEVSWKLSRRQEPAEYFVFSESTLGGGDILGYY